MEPDNYQTKIRLAAKLEAKREAQQKAKPISQRINDHGKITIWLIKENKYQDFWPIDARLLLERGEATLEKPEVEPEPENEVEPEQPEEIETKPIIVLPESMTVPELREFANVNGIDLKGLTLKPDILEAIKKAQAVNSNPKIDNPE